MDFEQHNENKALEDEYTFTDIEKPDITEEKMKISKNFEQCYALEDKHIFTQNINNSDIGEETTQIWKNYEQLYGRKALEDEYTFTDNEKSDIGEETTQISKNYEQSDGTKALEDEYTFTDIEKPDITEEKMKISKKFEQRYTNKALEDEYIFTDTDKRDIDEKITQKKEQSYERKDLEDEYISSDIEKPDINEEKIKNSKNFEQPYEKEVSEDKYILRDIEKPKNSIKKIKILSDYQIFPASGAIDSDLESEAEPFPYNNSSDEDYVPSSEYSSSTDEELRHTSVQGPAAEFLIPQASTSQILGQPSLAESTTVKVIGSFEQKLKKDLCPFCFKEVDHFARHLFTHHSDEDAVRKILQMPLKSNERRGAIMSIRKRGNFILHEQKNKVKVVRSSNKHRIMDPQENSEYFPCVSCLGFYKKSYLWRHNKICKSKVDQKIVRSRCHLTDSQTFLATTGMLGNILNRSRIKKEVFSIMRPDDISYAAKTDALICLFGESYINKHKRKQMNVVVSNKMRELARLKIALAKSTTIESLMDVLKPECYEIIVAATKLISGYDPQTKTFHASSLALHMGTTLKFLCDVATKAILTKNPLFPKFDNDKKLKDIEQIRLMISSHWCNDVSSLANKVLNEQKVSKPKLLPFTEDIRTLYNHVKTLAGQAFENLSNNKDIETNYKVLSECTLVLVVIFNRKRIGEVQFLTIEAYEDNNTSINQEECLSSLSELERSMSAAFKRVVVFGKGSKPVPILFTKMMQKYIAMLLAIRSSTTVVPKPNRYIFANPNSDNRWISGPAVLRKYANTCGAKNPELLTSTRFRKQLATILQLMNFENDEMEQIARFMGHTEKTHKEFYRLTEDVYQTAKVAKVLLLLNNGQGAEFKGKSLAEIDVGDDIIEDDADSGTIEETHEKENDEDNGTTHENNVDHNETSDDVAQIQGNKRGKSARKRWTAKEKQLVLRHFKKHVKSKTAPKKNECLQFIHKNGNNFDESDWIRIKTLVFNTYRML